MLHDDSGRSCHHPHHKKAQQQLHTAAQSGKVPSVSLTSLKSSASRVSQSKLPALTAVSAKKPYQCVKLRDCEEDMDEQVRFLLALAIFGTQVACHLAVQSPAKLAVTCSCHNHD